MATQLLANVEENWTRQSLASFLDLEGCKGQSDVQFHVGRQLLDHVPLPNSSGTDAEGSDSGSREVGIGP